MRTTSDAIGVMNEGPPPLTEAGPLVLSYGHSS